MDASPTSACSRQTAPQLRTCCRYGKPHQAAVPQRNKLIFSVLGWQCKHPRYRSGALNKRNTRNGAFVLETG
ncbi:hypothetical protein HPB48_020474 [Haemaphysalis longicornis]|uniref:Uncharacterized protein n=1 Tax=Haemaphysalis longicornis TaxID=44386 RepID=A0A9J6FCQ2_HAELO|nr:hypothetical protein HPB48_020474 [Haemaphysalis longicornis]